MSKKKFRGRAPGGVGEREERANASDEREVFLWGGGGRCAGKEVGGKRGGGRSAIRPLPCSLWVPIGGETQGSGRGPHANAGARGQKLKIGRLMAVFYKQILAQLNSSSSLGTT